MSASRIDAAFERVRASASPGLITYVTAGDPDLSRTADLLKCLPDAGADILEVGIPFSDPLADGPVIQRASERALRSGTTLVGVLDMLQRTRHAIDAPIVLFTYANPIERLGYEEFLARAASAGIDGVLVLDLPIDEAGPLADRLREHDLAPIYLVSPTTPAARVRRAGQLGCGFLYAISRLGVTGVQRSLSDDAAAVVKLVRREATLPVALGFGISTPEHVRTATSMADAAVVGSALVDVIAGAAADGDVTTRACEFVRWLKGTR